MIGAYGEQAAISTFVTKNDDGSKARSDLVRLIGKRMIVASENKKEVKLDSGLIKEWSGDAEIVARGLYKEEVKFKPRASIWLATNHKPIIDDNSDGVWRRLLMVHFGTQVPEEKRDTGLLDYLTENESEGILRWCIEGAVKFTDNGLVVPQKVRDFTNDYREEQQPVEQFVKDMLEPTISDEDYVLLKDLKSTLEYWAQDTGTELHGSTGKLLTESILKVFKSSRKVHSKQGIKFTCLKLQKMSEYQYQ